MATRPIDPLNYTRDLRAAGFDEPQAEAVARVVLQATGQIAERAITHGEVAQEFALARAETRALFAELRAEMKAQTDAIRTEMDLLRAEMKAQTDAIRAEMAGFRSETRADILAVKTELKADIADVRLELEKRVGGVERDTLVLKWMMGFVLAGLLALLLRAFGGIILR